MAQRENHELTLIDTNYLVGAGAWSAALRAKIEGGSLFAHRACGTTYAAHSLELKVKASLKIKGASR